MSIIGELYQCDRCGKRSVTPYRGKASSDSSLPDMWTWRTGVAGGPAHLCPLCSTEYTTTEQSIEEFTNATWHTFWRNEE